MSRAARHGVIFILLFLCRPGIGADRIWQGESLKDYIDAMRAEGLRIIYSTDLVSDEYRLADEPTGGDPESALREALAPFGLSLRAGPSGSLLITGQAVARPAVKAENEAADGRAKPFSEPLPEIVVTSSLYNIRYDDGGSHHFLERGLSARMPDLGEEAVRTIARLPGTSGGGVSTRHHVRGGVQNEQLFLLDGLRLYEPYHLKDFHSIATIVDQNAIAGIDFYSAGYPVRYGDRMSGVVDISLREPPERAESELGLSFFNTWALSRGRFGGNDRGDWLVSGRRGNLDLLADAINSDYGSPRYQDYLAHAGWNFRDHTYLSANALLSYDKISIADTDDTERANAKYRNSILWLKAESAWTEQVESSTVLSATDIDNQRSGVTDRPGVISGSVDDARTFRSLALKQDWVYTISDRWLLSAGFELKRLEAEYRYDAALAISAPFDRILDNQSTSNRSIEVSPRGSQYAGYTELRIRLGDTVTLDAGLRWDQQTYTTASDDQLSPRINLLYRPDDDTELRLAFGEYYQAQEINELQVSDGEFDFNLAQRAQHLVASLSQALGPLDLRVEAYQKKYRSLIPRFENIFDSLVLIPELQVDRARIDADSAIAEGIEVTLSGTGAGELSWWASYAWSRTGETIQGQAVDRSWDQTHAVNGGFSVDWKAWSFSAAGVVHTGWPKTALASRSVQDPDGSTNLVVFTEPRNSRRHAVFQSLDARVSRRFDLRKGELTAFLEITNLYDRENPCCTEYSIVSDADGNSVLRGRESNWLPIVPSLGVIWRF